MSTTILVDGKMFDSGDNVLRTLNIALKAGRVAALGYLDEEDGVQPVSLKGCLIVNQAFNVLDKFSVMDGQHVSELIHHGGFSASGELVVARVSVSEFMFVLQELSVLSGDVLLHLVLAYMDEDVLEVLESRKLPEGVSVGVVVDEVPVDLCERLYGMVMNGRVTSLSTGGDAHICTWLMSMFGEKAPTLMALLFERYAVDVLGLTVVPIAIGKPVSFVAVATTEPYGVVVHVEAGNVMS